MKHAKALSDTENTRTKPKGGGHRALRSARRKAYYAARAPFTLANKKSKMGAHVRAFPEDLQHVEQFKKRYSEAALTGHLASPTSKARKRARQRARQAKLTAAIKHQPALIDA